MRWWSAFGISIACHGLAVGAVLLFCILAPLGIEQLTNKPPSYVEIPILTKPLETPALRIQKPVAKLDVPKITVPQTETLVLPPEQPAPAPENPQVATPVPPMALSSSSLPARPTETQPKREPLQVRTGVLGSSVEVATVKLPAREVQTGGFGSPAGLAGEAWAVAKATSPSWGPSAFRLARAMGMEQAGLKARAAQWPAQGLVLLSRAEPKAIAGQVDHAQWPFGRVGSKSSRQR